MLSAIEDICGKCEIAEHKESDKVRSPGVKYKHYKPKCETMLFTKEQIEQIKNTSIEEINYIRQNTKIELEVFIHGALSQCWHTME